MVNMICPQLTTSTHHHRYDTDCSARTRVFSIVRMLFQDNFITFWRKWIGNVCKCKRIATETWEDTAMSNGGTWQHLTVINSWQQRRFQSFYQPFILHHQNLFKAHFWPLCSLLASLAVCRAKCPIGRHTSAWQYWILDTNKYLTVLNTWQHNLTESFGWSFHCPLPSDQIQS